MTKDLFKKFLQGNCQEEEFEQLLSWIKTEALTLSGRDLAIEIWDEFEPGTAADEQKYGRILDKIHHRINLDHTKSLYEKKPVFRQKVITIITRVAAVLLLPVLSLLLYTNLPSQKTGSNLRDLEVAAPLSSKTYFELGDGTKVWLNNGSKLRYPYQFKGKSRKVFLNGEAYFDVASNKKMPFIVEANQIEVKATGTEFNVMAYAGDGFIETSLVAGKVILYNKNNNQEIKSLNPNESVRYFTGTNTYTEDFDHIEKNISWKDGLLIFENDPIEDVALKLSRWYNVEVSFNDQVRKYTYTAKFADETLPQVLELLELATPVSYELAPRKKLPDGSYSKQKVLIRLKERFD
ncbi:MAG: FecR family protein [Mangrovibacterium sp.]